MITSLALALALPLTAPVYPHRDIRLTPGVVAVRDTAVICQAKYAGTARGEHPVTSRVRGQVMESYGLANGAKGYTLDHVVSIELGGATDDPRNLYPGEPAQEKRKDRVENALHDAVCNHGLALWKAQGCLAVNWSLCEKWYLRR